MTNEISIEDMKAYVRQVDEKADAEHISIKHASAKLGRKVWAYYKYKAQLRTMERGQQQLKQVVSEARPMEEQPQAVAAAQTITIALSDDVMAYLEQEAEGYATTAAIVAQLLLHDVVRQKIKAGGKQ